MSCSHSSYVALTVYFPIFLKKHFVQCNKIIPKLRATGAELQETNMTFPTRDLLLPSHRHVCGSVEHDCK